MLKIVALCGIIGSIIGVAVWFGVDRAGWRTLPDYISAGEIVDLEQFLAQDQYTLFFFSSNTCAISQETLSAVEPILPTLDFAAFRKIDVTEPTAPILEEYRVRYTPHCILYDPQGQVVDASPEICFLFENLLTKGLLQEN